METPPTNDSLFRCAFSYPEIARQFFVRWIPRSEASLFDWNSLRQQKMAGFTRDLVERREDVLYRIRSDRGEVDTYILLEHQSKEDRSMAFRICEYVMIIWRLHRERYRKQRPLPFVLPMVVYLGSTPWKGSPLLSELIDVPKVAKLSWIKQWLLELQCYLVDLTEVLPLASTE